jgi:predicted TPR repeat methyltransferase
MENIYTNKTYLQNNPTWHEEGAAIKARDILKILYRNNLSFNSVCEIGCGSGEILAQLQKQLGNNISFRGYDISPAAINIAKKKETTNLHFELRDFTEQPNEFYDLLLVIDVIEHLENYFSFLKSIRSKGAFTIFHIPLDVSIWSLFREQILIESKQRVGHIHNFTEAFIKSILKDIGFTIVDSFYTPPTFEKISFKQKVINVVRKGLFKLNKRFCTKVLGGYSIMLLAKNDL